MAGTYRVMHGALSEALRGAPDDVLDDELGPDVAEWLGAVGNAINTITPYVKKAAPGMLQGAVTGVQMGGPWGALLGAGAGGLAGATGTSLGGLTGGAPGVMPAMTGSPAAVAPGFAGIANPAAAQLLGALMRPEVLQALLAQAMGASGATTVPVQGVAVPVTAYTNLIQSLAAEANAAHRGAPMRRTRKWSERVARASARAPEAETAAIHGAALLELLARAEADEDRERAGDAEYDEADHDADFADLLDLARLEGY
jgi:hypothetical protein